MSTARTIDHVIFDVDDVVINMDLALAAAEAAVEPALSKFLGAETAVRVRETFTKNYGVLLGHLRLPPGEKYAAYDVLRARIEDWQRGVTQAGFEVKQWSRDTLLACALEDTGVKPTAALVDAAIGAYWHACTEATRLYPDAERICARLRDGGVTFHLATNSDGFLSLDTSRHTFVYDPPQSAERKVARLGATKALGIARQNITVGDPIGKPGVAYYARVLVEFANTHARPLDLSRTLAVGDSLKADVLPFLSAGVARGAWLVRAARESGVDAASRVPIIRSLDELVPMIWETPQ